ncbi:hypothetical protein MML63_12675 [Kosakonia sacchari]|uniref:DUF3592 domain-containing protein n=1 Tax=Kosakonia sacchari TaxID=1158459 RepID=UPI0025B0DFDB|nr:DUF3592 domain-containing protein [Kosakonia sacchari]MDN2486480.1 hypothetical protein [Kosakonia sacchari]
MYISYFVTYPLLVVFFGMFVFFVYNIIMAGRGTVKIDAADAVEAQGEIVNIRSSSGENSAFINVVIQVRFITTDHKIVNTEGKAVIDVVKIPEYKKGIKVPLIYSRKEPKKIKLKIPSPLDK